MQSIETELLVSLDPFFQCFPGHSIEEFVKPYLFNGVAYSFEMDLSCWDKMEVSVNTQEDST